MISSKRLEGIAEKNNKFALECVQKTFKSDEGKVALLWLMEKASFFVGFNDAISEHKNAGRRELIGELLTELKVDLKKLAVEEEPMDLLDRILEDG